MDRRLRVAFMGTPEFAVPALRAVLESGHDLLCVYTQPPRPKGRGQQPALSPVHQLGLDKGIEVRTPATLKTPEEAAAFSALNLDVAVVAAYGLILPRAILEAPKHGCLNIHGSLLPRWRGAAPIQRAIEAGDEETGITIMQMDVGLDTGAMISKGVVPIENKTTAASLHDSLAVLGAQMIGDALKTLAQQGTLPATPQPEEGATYAKMLKKEEGRIDWSRSSLVLDRAIRAFTPWPGSWCENEAGARLKILEAEARPTTHSGMISGHVFEESEDILVACGEESALRLLRVHPENKKPMSAQDALRGGYLSVGGVLR